MGMGGLGRGDPLWIFFAFVFNAVWEKSTLMPPSHDPDGPRGLRKDAFFLRGSTENSAPCHWDKKTQTCHPTIRVLAIAMQSDSCCT